MVARLNFFGAEICSGVQGKRLTPVLGTAPAADRGLDGRENFAPPKAEPQVETFSPAEPDPAHGSRKPEPDFPPIDLQPISETARAAEVSFDSTFTELTTGSAASNLPELNRRSRKHARSGYLRRLSYIR
jgi:hypothetical protein